MGNSWRRQNTYKPRGTGLRYWALPAGGLGQRTKIELATTCKEWRFDLGGMLSDATCRSGEDANGKVSTGDAPSDDTKFPQRNSIKAKKKERKRDDSTYLKAGPNGPPLTMTSGGKAQNTQTPQNATTKKKQNNPNKNQQKKQKYHQQVTSNPQGEGKQGPAPHVVSTRLKRTVNGERLE